MKFKVGDKVRIRKDLKVHKEYDNIIYDDTMSKYKGKIATISGFGIRHYYLDIDNRYNCWTDEMLEPVKEDVIEYKNKIYDVYKEIDCDNNKFNKVLQLKEVKEEILDDIEKEYLENVIRPFRNRIIGIEKRECYMSDLDVESEIISIIDKNQGHSLLPFRKNSMYVGMKLNEPYTLEQLGLE